MLVISIDVLQRSSCMNGYVGTPPAQPPAAGGDPGPASGEKRSGEALSAGESGPTAYRSTPDKWRWTEKGSRCSAISRLANQGGERRLCCWSLPPLEDPRFVSVVDAQQPIWTRHTGLDGELAAEWPGGGGRAAGQVRTVTRRGEGIQERDRERVRLTDLTIFSLDRKPKQPSPDIRVRTKYEAPHLETGTRYSSSHLLRPTKHSSVDASQLR